MAKTPAEIASLLFTAHPWHGIGPGPASPESVTCYIEIVPSDTVKYELDKASGQLKIDRVHRYSSLCPTLYGFIPQTYCGDEVGKRCQERTKSKTAIKGDGDPLDVCVLTEKTIPKGGFILRATVIGGLRMVEAGEADDKIVAVLDGDAVYGAMREISEVPEGVVERLRHYFLTYKQLPADAPRRVDIGEVYDRAEAHEVIRRSLTDYRATFGDPDTRLAELATTLTRK